MMLAWHNDGSDTSEFEISYMELCNLTTDGARLVLQTTENPIQPWNFPGLTFRKVLTNRINIADDLELLLDISVDMTGITGDDGMEFTVYLCDNADGATWNHVSWDFTVGGMVGSKITIQDYDATIGETGESTEVYGQAWANSFDGVIKISRVAGIWYFYLDNTLLVSSDFGQFGFSSIEFKYSGSVWDNPRTFKPVYMNDTKLYHGEEPTDIPVTGVTLNKKAVAIKPGNTELLIATVIPDNATDKKVNWSSNNPNIATVDDTGLVTAVSPGNAFIYARSNYDKNIYSYCQIIVMQPVTGVSLDKHDIVLIPGEFELLTATVLPANASIKGVTWGSNNTDIATVDSNGLVTAVYPGVTYVYVVTKDGGFYDTCQVNVALPVLPEYETNCSQGLLSSRYKPTVINIRRL